jgi:type II secretory pathway pseudopilin PulG
MKNNKGFSLVGIIASIALVAAVLVVGIYVVTRNDKAQEAPSQQKAESGSDDSASLSRADIAKAPAETTKFSTLPKELQAVIKNEVTKQAPGCIKEGQLVDYNGQPEDPNATYAAVGSAFFVIGCDGGSVALFAKNKEGQWAYIVRTQADFSCDDIFNYPVPKQLLELKLPRAECYDTATKKVLTYDEASSARYY